ncbi:hypothetical protein HMI54_013534, partial [Coelomomyces lativittatus]
GSSGIVLESNFHPVICNPPFPPLPGPPSPGSPYKAFASRLPLGSPWSPTFPGLSPLLFPPTCCFVPVVPFDVVLEPKTALLSTSDSSSSEVNTFSSTTFSSFTGVGSFFTISLSTGFSTGFSSFFSSFAGAASSLIGLLFGLFIV